MKTELHVTYPQAKTLRELGFDWETSYYYDDNEGGKFLSGSEYFEEGDYINESFTLRVESLMGNNNVCPGRYSAPTTAQVIRWLYKTFGLVIITSLNNTEGWSWIIKKVTFLSDDSPYCIERAQKGIGYKSPEDAELEAISECLKLLKK